MASRLETTRSLWMVILFVCQLTWWSGNCSITESLPDLVLEVRHDLAGALEASFNGDQVGNDSLLRVLTPNPLRWPYLFSYIIYKSYFI